MNLLKKRPGEILFIAFILGGLALTTAVALAESVSGLAGNGFGPPFDGGVINGSAWFAERH